MYTYTNSYTNERSPILRKVSYFIFFLYSVYFSTDIKRALYYIPIFWYIPQWILDGIDDRRQNYK